MKAELPTPHTGGLSNPSQFQPYQEHLVSGSILIRTVRFGLFTLAHLAIGLGLVAVTFMPAYIEPECCVEQARSLCLSNAAALRADAYVSHRYLDLAILVCVSWPARQTGSCAMAMPPARKPGTPMLHGLNWHWQCCRCQQRAARKARDAGRP